MEGSQVIEAKCDSQERNNSIPRLKFPSKGKVNQRLSTGKVLPHVSLEDAILKEWVTPHGRSSLE